MDKEPEHLCKLFIGGLDYRTTEETLTSQFEQYGEIVDVIVMKDPHTKRSRGFGFVTFSKSYMLDDAQKAKPHTIDGREVDTKRAVPRDQVGPGGKVESKNSKKLFLGGIKDLSENEIRDHFNGYGEITNVYVPTDRETQKNRGFAFVEFADYDAADKACLQGRITISDTEVDVQKAKDKNEGGGGGRGGRGGAGGRGGYGGGRGGSYGGSGGYGGNSGGYGGNSGGYGGSSGGYGGSSGGYGGSSGGYGGSSGGYGGSSGGYGGSSGGYGQDSYGGGAGGYSQGGYGGGYNQSSGGGPTRSSYNQGSRSTPYGDRSSGGYGSSNNGYQGGDYNSGGRRY